jgi:Helix-turn-helix domain
LIGAQVVLTVPVVAGKIGPVGIMTLAREIIMSGQAEIAQAEIREPLGSPADVADHLQIPEKTLAEWRHHGDGPRYLRVGRYVRYRWADVEEWLAGQARGGDAA